MSARDLVALIHLVGFATGIVLYGMLALMTRRAARQPETAGGGIAVLAALLGLLWNAGALIVYGWQDFGLGQVSPWIEAVSYSALGFLPAVVVDSATRSRRPGSWPSPLALAAYLLSAIATVMHVLSVARAGTVCSNALLSLTIGYVAVVMIVAALSIGRTGSQRALTVVALAAFAVSALHLSRHTGSNDSWFVELIGHHASLPLVLVILYQDYRFALADLFLKRALALLLLVSLVLAAYALLLAPLAANTADLPIGLPALLLAGWIATALAYPWLRRAAERFVDRVILGRPDYRQLRATLVERLSVATSEEQALDAGRIFIQAVVDRQAEATVEQLGAGRVDDDLVATESGGVSVVIPTAEND